MTHTFVIAEAGSTHDNDLAKAYRLIEAAKECGADAVKFQWTSNAQKMAERRGHPEWATGYSKYLQKPESWLYSLKQHADKVGIEWMCTAYLIEDIAVLAPIVKRFKISAFESDWAAFIMEHLKGPSLKGGKWNGQDVIISLNPGKQVPMHLDAPACVKTIYCVSSYPAELWQLHLAEEMPLKSGFSDHTTSVLTGAIAIAASTSASPIIEKHIRLHDTDPGNPDYGHSLQCDGEMDDLAVVPFRQYVMNIRTAEKAL